MAVSKRIIARLDVKGARLIKGVRFEGLRVIGEPCEASKRYAQQGADELLYVDAVASLYGRNSLSHLLEQTCRDVFIPITAGGGVRSVSDAGELLSSGADKVAVNTAALERPELISEIAQKFGKQCVVASIQARKIDSFNYEAMKESGRERSGRDVMSWIQELQELGAGEILLTSVDNDGTCSGPDENLVSRSINQIKIPMIYGGGISNEKEAVETLRVPNLSAICIGAGLHYNKLSIKKIKNTCISDSRLNIRLEEELSAKHQDYNPIGVTVGIIDYGMGNLQSLSNALKSIGCNIIISSNTDELVNSDILALPGVGAFPEGMKQLASRGMDVLLHEWVKDAKPLFGICLGMQMLFSSSEEFCLTEGLDLISGRVVKLSDHDETGYPVTVPNVGWSRVQFKDNDWGKFDGSFQYFVHSYAALDCDEDCEIYYAKHGGKKFIAAVRKKNIFGFQFHPERSGEVGLKLLRDCLGSVSS